MTILVFVLLVGFLILVHELGHFLMALREGVRVEEFAIGFPPRLWAKKKGKTVYSLNLLPLGGFVKLHGEHERLDKESFLAKPIFSRFKIVVAGALMNLLAGYLLLVVYFALGGSPLAYDPQTHLSWIKEAKKIPVVVGVESNSPAEKAGLKVGDLIFKVDGLEPESAEEFAHFIEKKKPNEKVKIQIRRGKEEFQLEVGVANIEGHSRTGVMVANYYWRIKFYPWAIPLVAFLDLVHLLWAILYFLYNFILALFRRAKPIGEIAGPVGVYFLTKEALKLGLVYVLRLAILLTANLAVINLLPIPALDGGKALFLALEKIRGKRVSAETENLIHLIGFAIILGLILVVSVRDILKLF